jgi:phosphatidylglycerol:prolipoprotein diacylglycerol transferase
VSLHPTQIYAFVGNLILFLAWLSISKASPPRGILTAVYFIGYGMFRFLIEFVRNDYRGPVWGGLHPSQWISLLAVGTGVTLATWVLKKERT